MRRAQSLGTIRSRSTKEMETHENWIEATRYLNMDLLREHKKQLLREVA